ncbi:unnamed protein product [Timema podura]|uniref:Dynactin subunit 4 n=1 Tax=Timema podura TaxID=61482 RepID=A0ABN7P7R6_TIMPD|nr:unnamed protein product [Timema podura]
MGRLRFKSQSFVLRHGYRHVFPVTTLPQRLSQPDFQPLLTQGLLPIHKQFLIKRSQRCRVCEHNVSKPEYNPASTKFKIQLFAYYHVPEVRLVTCEPLRPGDVSQLIIKLSNPTQHQTTIQFAALPSPEEERAELDKELEEKKKKREVEKKEGEVKMTSLRDDIFSCPSLFDQTVIYSGRFSTAHERAEETERPPPIAPTFAARGVPFRQHDETSGH